MTFEMCGKLTLNSRSKDIRSLKHFLEFEMARTEHTIIKYQRKYLSELLDPLQTCHHLYSANTETHNGWRPTISLFNIQPQIICYARPTHTLIFAILWTSSTNMFLVPWSPIILLRFSQYVNIKFKNFKTDLFGYLARWVKLKRPKNMLAWLISQL